MAKTGRPTKYKAEFAEQAFKLCLLGADDARLADFFEVDVRTIDRWKLDHVEFCRALKEGKGHADARVADSLYNRALGYSHPEVKVFMHEGQPIEHEVIKHYPPDTTACIFWLKNRQKDDWRDKTEIAGKVEMTLAEAMGQLLGTIDGATRGLPSEDDGQETRH